ncbi:hypothetical protein AB0G04_28885 [Actinoplanes sp. NPDC023801]|uniref:hypothetical protein n=1 Tax=Actinoplanes sp. NPDC023801 TaxID=3154595 RepID=UPI0033DBE67C
MPTAMPKFKPVAFPEANPTDRVAAVIMPPQHVWVHDLDEGADEAGGPPEPKLPELPAAG